MIMFDLDTIPSLSAEELADAEATIRSLAAEVNDETALEDIEALAATLDAIDSEKAVRSAASEQRELLLTRFAVSTEEKVEEKVEEPKTEAKSFAFVKNAPKVDTTPVVTEDEKSEVGMETAEGLVASMDDMASAWTKFHQGSKAVQGKSIFAKIDRSTDIDDSYDGNIRTLTAAACGPAAVEFGFVCPLPGEGQPINDLIPTVTTDRAQVTFQTDDFDITDFDDAFDVDSVCAVAVPDKTCFELVCADSETVCLDWNSVCITVPNALAKFAPETLQRQLSYLASASDRVSELKTYAQIIAVAGAAVVAPQLGYSVSSAVANTLARYVAGRQAELRGNATEIKAIIPAWVRDAIKADHAVRNVSMTDAQVATWIEDVSGITQVAWSYDIQPLPAGVTQYPATVDITLFEGGVRYSGGELNIGEFRDGDLIKANKYSIFSETFEAVARFCDAVTLTVPVCPSGVDVPRSTDDLC